MLLLFIALTATGTLIGRNNGFLRHASSSARHKVLDHSAALLRSQLKSAVDTKSEITLRDGLGENLPFPAIGYLGTGYDILKGNPEGNAETLLDPGFRGPVITLTWSQDSRFNTRDMARLVPTQATGLPMVACQHTSKAVEMSEMSDYTDSLEEDASQTTEVGAGGGGFGVKVAANAKFSSSSGVSDFRQDVLSTDSKRYSMKSFCIQYQMILHTPANVLETSEYFNKRAAMLDILVVPPQGACLEYLCTNLYIDEVSAYIGVSGSNVVLQKKHPGGQWLFDSGGHVFWLSAESQSRLDDTKVLTIQNGKPVIAALDKKKFTHQQWGLAAGNLFLVSMSKSADPSNRAPIAIGYDKEGQVESHGLPTLLAKPGIGIAVTRNYFPPQQAGRWLMFIQDFGTHFVHSLQLGGRMVTTVTMSSKDVEEIEKHGKSASWAVAASASVDSKFVDVEASHEQNKNSKSQKDTMDAFKNAQRDTKTLVLGGDPPEDMSEETNYGFGEWAATVPKKPMPVKITLTPLTSTEPFQCDNIPAGKELDLLNSFRTKRIEGYTHLERTRCREMRATFGVMFHKYQEGSLQRFRTENMEAEAAKEFTPSKNSWTSGIYTCPSRVRSENGKYTAHFRCDGTFDVQGTFGTLEWAALPVEVNKRCAGTEAILSVENSVFSIKCSANRKPFWHSYPTADGCGVTDHKKTKLHLMNDGNLLLMNGDANPDHSQTERKGKMILLWQSSFFKDRVYATDERMSRYANFQREDHPGQGYIFCETARKVQKKEYLAQIQRESEKRHAKKHQDMENERRRKRYEELEADKKKK